MLAREKKNGTTAIVLGIALEVAGQVLAGLTDIPSFSLMIVGGAVCFLYGCVQIAKAKGQPWFYGLLGMLSCIGLAVLWFVIEDKHKDG